MKRDMFGTDTKPKRESPFGISPYAGKLPSNTTDTSKAAAVAAAPTAETLRSTIYDMIDRCADGLTDYEGEEILSLKCQTYTARRCELKELGLVYNSGKRRKTDTGCYAIVWESYGLPESGMPKYKRRPKAIDATKWRNVATALAQYLNMCLRMDRDTWDDDGASDAIAEVAAMLERGE